MEEITPELFLRLGLALSTAKGGTYAVGYDVRRTSPLLAKAFECGLNAGGSDTISCGLLPTPALAYLSRGVSGGVMITASHNPPEYNGAKLFDGRGASLTQADYSLLLESLRGQLRYAGWESIGSSRGGSGLHRYLDWLESRAQFRRNWHVGVDPGNGSTCLTAAMAMKGLGCGVEAINAHPDPAFKGRGPEPTEAALSQLSELVSSRHLDVGFAYDGDGDRFAVVDEEGRPLKQDLALAFAASMMVKRGNRDVVVNVDTSSVVDFMVEGAGGRVHRAPVGDVYVLESILKLNAPFGGETCGAWIFPRESLCPDGVLSSILFLSMLEDAGIRPSQIREGVPEFHTERRKVPCPGVDKAELISSVAERATGWFSGASVERIDGIRVSFRDGSWLLLRPSGTEPIVRVTSESKERSAASRLADEAVSIINEAMGELKRGA